MNPPFPMDMAAKLEARRFQVWEFQVSHGQLLIRSPQAPSSGRSPAQDTNIDIVFLGVEFMCVPRFLDGLALRLMEPDELSALDSLFGTATDSSATKWVLESGGRRHVVVALAVSVSENMWDIFDSPFEFRSQFRGHALNGDPGA